MVQDPQLTIQNLLDNNWNTANTSISSKPEVFTGWRRAEATKPQVTVSTPDEGPLGGASTPFRGIDPSGAGPVQDINGFVDVNCWSDREVESSVNPKKLTYEFSEEVKRIVKANTLSATDLDFIGYDGRSFLVDPEANPTVFRYQVTIQYGYQNRP